ncbi:MAG: hypothetical protein GQF41_1936 [Candidatus Rifleibacterium amylolyticum]|nr:MAG: hypothetical protein GQF41_1936 [Candidatus Rifleibacterium amylolyticum]
MEKKLLLISPPLHCEQHLRQSFQPPLNLLCLYSYLRSKGLAVELYEASSVQDAIQKVIEGMPIAVGMPLYYASLANAAAIVAGIRKATPEIRLIAGGPCLTMEPERMLGEIGFDFGVCGEGEETLHELLNAIYDRDDYCNIDGLAYQHEEAVKVNRRRAPIADLDQLPFVDYSPVDNNKYFALQKQAGIPETIFMNTSRGCFYRCTYCCTPVLWPGAVRRYSPGRMVEEIKHQLNLFPNAEIGFCDDSFFSDRRWLDSFLELVRPMNIRFQCIGRADHLNREYIEKLATAGMTYIAFGVETGCSERQKTLRKNLDFARMFETMRSLADFNIKTKCFFMLGFPDETPEEIVETINLAVELRKMGMTYFSIFPVTLYPGTELAKQFPQNTFNCALDAHMPEIIRDGLAIDNPNLLNSRYNDLMTQGQMAEIVTLAWQKVDKSEHLNVEELKNILTRTTSNQ